MAYDENFSGTEIGALIVNVVDCPVIEMRRADHVLAKEANIWRTSIGTNEKVYILNSREITIARLAPPCSEATKRTSF